MTRWTGEGKKQTNQRQEYKGLSVRSKAEASWLVGLGSVVESKCQTRRRCNIYLNLYHFDLKRIVFSGAVIPKSH